MSQCAGCPTIHAKILPTSGRMLRYILAFLLFFLLAGGASAAAIATGAPAPAKVAFLVCLGLFVAAIVDGVAERRHVTRRPGDGIARDSSLSAVPGDRLSKLAD